VADQERRRREYRGQLHLLGAILPDSEDGTLEVNGVTKYLRRSLLSALGVIALLPAVAATTGSVTGLFKDDMGMPVAGGKVTLVDLGKGTSTMATTNSKGYYGSPLVMPGVYKLQAEDRGSAGTSFRGE
jgi:hypothetical protein